MASITLKNVSISFPVLGMQRRSFSRSMVAFGTGGRIGLDQRRRVAVQALSKVSLKLEHGDRVALLGHNGAGKSTLLRVMAGIYEPTGGQVAIEGVVAPVFDLTLGMDAESTGYDNILLRGLYLGMSYRQVAELTPAIAEFTELGDYLGMPLRTYSAGMRARLAFAVSTCIEPDVLLLDEGIGAGDASFTRKAQERVDELVSRSGILALATHSGGLARTLCDKGIILQRGEIVAAGGIEEVFDTYDEMTAKLQEQATGPQAA